MKSYKLVLGISTFILLTGTTIKAQGSQLAQKAEDAMLRATKYMVEKVSTNGVV
jgi:hypothetical protein